MTCADTSGGRRDGQHSSGEADTSGNMYSGGSGSGRECCSAQRAAVLAFLNYSANYIMKTNQSPHTSFQIKLLLLHNSAAGDARAVNGQQIARTNIVHRTER